MIRLRTLGGLALEADGEAPARASVIPRRRLALLAVLAAAGPIGVTRDVLLSLFWPESDTERARNALAQALFVLRRELPAGAIGTGATELRLDPALVPNDVAAFEAALEARELERAVALYTGPFLEGVLLRDAPEFERWAEGVRARLEHRYGHALEELAQAASARGDHVAAVGWWRQRATTDPLSSRVALRLAQAHAAAGDATAGLRHVALHEALVRQELGAGPDAAVLEYAATLQERANARDLTTRDAATRDVTAVRAPALDDVAAAAAAPGAPAPAERTPAGRTPAPGGRPARRRTAAAGTLPVAAVAAVAARLPGRRATRADDGRTRALQPDRVVVAALENATGDSTLDRVGRMAGDWITHGLAQTGLVQVSSSSPAVVSATRRDAPPSGTPAWRRQLAVTTGAALVVSGAVHRDGDSLRLHVQITDELRGELLASVGPVGASLAEPLDGVERLRQRVVAVLATHVDPRLAGWAAAASRPTTFEAYAEYAAGLELYFQRRYDAAIVHLRSAHARDTAFTVPLVWATFAHGVLGQQEAVDSLLVVLASRRERLAPWDRGLLDYQLAMARFDWDAAHGAMQRVVAVAPGSEWLYMLALAALQANRPRAALAALDQLDPERGWMREWPHYWHLRAAAQHALGEYAAELAVVRRGRAQFPDEWDLVFKELRALAALGDVEAVEREVARSLARPQDYGENAGAVMRHAALALRTHGHRAAADRMTERALRHLHGLDARDAATLNAPLMLARLLSDAGRWREAEPLLRELVATLPPEPWTRDVRCRAVIAAEAVGDSDGARRLAHAFERVERRTAPGEVAYCDATRALAAGERDRAVVLLGVALARSARTPALLHDDAALLRLDGHPAFEALNRPAEERPTRPPRA